MRGERRLQQSSVTERFPPGEPWNKPNGLCAQCGGPLNEYCVGGYKLHDGEFSVAAAANMTDDQIEAAITASQDNIAALRSRLAARTRTTR